MRSFNAYVMAAAMVLATAVIESTASQDAGTSVWDGVYTDGQSKKGADTAKSACIACHGDELAGGDLGPALQGDDFRNAWAGRTAAELFEKIQTTMPADRPGSLKPEQTAELVAYVFKLNEFPAGSTDLAGDMAALGQIRIRVKR